MQGSRMIRSGELASILPNRGMVSNEGDARRESLTLAIGANDEVAPVFSSEVETANVQLKSSVVEYEDLLETTNEVQQQAMESQRELLQSRNDASLAALKQLDEGYRWATPSYYTRDKLVDELGTTIDSAILTKNMSHISRIKRANHRNEGSRSAVSSMAATPQTTSLHPDDGTRSVHSYAGRSSVSGRSHVSAVTTLPAEVGCTTSRVDEIVAELHQKLAPDQERAAKKELSAYTGAFFTPNGEALGAAMLTMHNIAHTDVAAFVKEKIATTQSSMDQKRTAALAHNAEWDQVASQGEDVAKMEQVIGCTLDAYEAAMACCGDRLNQLMMSSSSDGNFRSTYEQTHELVHSIVTDQRTAKTELVKSCEADREKVKADMAARTSVHEKATAAFIASRDASYQGIEDCAARQNVLWGQVAELVKQMGVVSEERAQLVKKHVTATEEEYHRRRVYDEYMAISGRHCDHLDMLAGLGGHSLHVLDSLENYYEHMTTAIDAKKFEEGTGDLKQAELRLFAELYRGYIKRSSELLARRNTRVLLTRRSLRLEDGLAKDYSAPDRPKHATARKEHQMLLEKLEADIDGLEQRSTKYDPLFQDVKAALAALEDSVEDPDEAAADELVAGAKAAAHDTNRADAAAVDVEAEHHKSQLETFGNREAAHKEKREQSPPRKQIARRRPVSPQSRGATPQQRHLTPQQQYL